MRRQAILFSILLGVLLLATVNCSMVPQVPWPIPAPTPTPKVRDFALRELFIDLTTLSPDCRIYEGPMPLSYEENAGAEEALFAWFHCYHPPEPPDGGMYAIYRFRDSQTAAKRYRNLAAGWWFYNADRVTPYEVPDWMQYRSPVANQFRFACADFYGGYPKVRSERCVAVGQYEEYVAAFSISISPPESMGDHAMLLEQILQAIDERMAHFLAEDTE